MLTRFASVEPQTAQQVSCTGCISACLAMVICPDDLALGYRVQGMMLDAMNGSTAFQTAQQVLKELCDICSEIPSSSSRTPVAGLCKRAFYGWVVLGIMPHVLNQTAPPTDDPLGHAVLLKRWYQAEQETLLREAGYPPEDVVEYFAQFFGAEIELVDPWPASPRVRHVFFDQLEEAYEAAGGQWMFLSASEAARAREQILRAQ